MSALKNRLKAVESALMPPQREKIIIVCSVVGYTSETDLIGYRCNNHDVMRFDNESLDDFIERAKTFFIENDEFDCGAFIFQPIYR